MAIVMGLDQHRAQIAAEWIDSVCRVFAESAGQRSRPDERPDSADVPPLPKVSGHGGRRVVAYAHRSLIQGVERGECEASLMLCIRRSQRSCATPPEIARLVDERLPLQLRLLRRTSARSSWLAQRMADAEALCWCAASRGAATVTALR